MNNMNVAKSFNFCIIVFFCKIGVSNSECDIENTMLSLKKSNANDFRLALNAVVNTKMAIYFKMHSHDASRFMLSAFF